MKKINILFIAIILLFGCGNNSTNKKEEKEKNNSSININKQLNITFLLDLSDRIEPTKYPNTPEHYQRDMAIINQFIDIFKADMEKKGGFMAKGKMKIIFSPKPQDPEINNIASKLNIDLSVCKNPKEKKVIFDNLTHTFSENLKIIYDKTISSKKYIGSDIWRFFKNDVKDYTIINDDNYRNILVLITDGYLYHKNSKNKKQNRTTYLLPNTIEGSGLRKSNWENSFKNGDYGFITERTDLDDLEILVLEINPSKNHLDDEDVIKAYLSKWFKEMNVKKFKIYNTDLPEYTKTRIEKFMNE